MSRAVPFIAAGALFVALVVLTWIGTPAPATRTIGGTPEVVLAARDFTTAQIQRAQSLAAQVRPWGIGSLLLGVVVSAVLGFTPWGARLIRWSSTPVGGADHPWRELLVGGFVLLLVGRLIVLPLDAAARAPRVRIGLVTQTWGSWLIDVTKSFVISTVVVLAAAAAVRALILALPTTWWIVGAAGAAALVVVLSFLYPIVIEPIFNSFAPMPPGPLRTSLLDLAAKDSIPVKDVLVADASRRGTAVNAYVSGLGASRRIVVYDTLLDQLDDAQVRNVVAHELGHVKANDVRTGTLLGALGAAAVVCLLGGLLANETILRRVGVASPSDPAVLAFVVGVIAVISFLSIPANNLVSRRIEARADVHALELTRDPSTLVRMQHRLTLTNISDPDPPSWVQTVFGSHPTGPQRIALARQWARERGLPVPADLAASTKGTG
jgi:STE24 endopeptidase